MRKYGSGKLVKPIKKTKCIFKCKNPDGACSFCSKKPIIVEILYFQGNKKINHFLRVCDLFKEGEGVFIPMKATCTVKAGTVIDEAWKQKVITAFKKGSEECDLEVIDFKFKLII